MTSRLGVLIAAALMVGVLAGPASADGSYTHLLDSDSAHGRNKTVEVRGTFTLQETTTGEDAFVIIIGAPASRIVQALAAVRCKDDTGVYTFEGNFTLRGGEAAILPTSPTNTYQTFPRYCFAYVKVTSKRGSIQADLGIWTQAL